MESSLYTLCIVLASFTTGSAQDSASQGFFGFVPKKRHVVADPHPNDIYTDVQYREPKVLDGFNIFYKDVGLIKYYTKDPEGPDYEFRRKGAVPAHELDRAVSVAVPKRRNPKNNPFIPHSRPQPRPQPVNHRRPQSVLPPRRPSPFNRPSPPRPQPPHLRPPPQDHRRPLSTHLQPPPRHQQLRG